MLDCLISTVVVIVWSIPTVEFQTKFYNKIWFLINVINVIFQSWIQFKTRNGLAYKSSKSDLWKRFTATRKTKCRHDWISNSAHHILHHHCLWIQQQMAPRYDSYFMTHLCYYKIKVMIKIFSNKQVKQIQQWTLFN